MINITHSSSECFRRCPRRYFWQYVQRLRRVGDRSEALELGSLVHEALETIWRGQAAAGTMAVIQAAIDTANARDDVQGREIAVLAGSMIMGYLARWPAPTDVIEVEQSFSLPVRVAGHPRALRGVRQQGKRDAMRRLAADATQLVEHKTASRVDGGYLDKLWSDAQITGYARAAEVERGIRCRSVLYDVIVKPPFKRGKGESVDLYGARLHTAYSAGRVAGKDLKRRGHEDDVAWVSRIAAEGESWDGYVREELIISGADMDRWAADFASLVNWIRGCIRRNDWPHFTRACYDWNRPCEYLPICRAGDNVECSGAEYEVIEDEHPELAKAAPQ